MPKASNRRGEQFARVGEIELCYEELGDPAGEPMLLVMGLATQMIHWEDGFCELLGEQGLRVIRFDNRDAGRSTVLDGPPPGTAAMLLGRSRGLAYTLDDLTDDAVGLLDALGIGSAHVTGVSMGGMIAQVMAYRRPERVRSLGLIMTGGGKRVSSVPRMRALGALLSRAPRDRESFATTAVRTFRAIGSSRFASRDETIRALALAAYDRGHSTAGAARQLHAITASGDRTPKLRTVRARAVVIHGTRDPLVRIRAGRSVAEAIPGARWVPIEGMAHDIPPEVWPLVVGELVANVRRAGEGAPASARAEPVPPRVRVRS
jgi:pimeloyl-ACP methyl ester carboxylesterase